MPKISKDFLQKVAGIQCPHQSTIILWILGILVMTGLTFKDLFPIWMDYNDEEQNTQVQIKVRLSDQEFLRPVLFICIPLATDREFVRFSGNLSDHLVNGSECKQCEEMAQHSYDVWTDNIFEEISKYNVSFDQILQRLFIDRLLQNHATGSTNHGSDQDPKNQAISAGNLSWNRPLIYSLSKFLTEQTKSEHRTISKKHSLPDHSMNQPLCDDRLALLNSLLVSFMCELMGVYNGSSENQLSHQMCLDTFRDSSLPVDDGRNNTYYCLRPPLNYTEKFNVYLERAYFEDYLNSEQRRGFRIMTENPWIHDWTMESLYRTPSGDLDELRQESVLLLYSPQSNVVDERPQKVHTCYNETTKPECVFNCERNRFEKHCGCHWYMSHRSFFPSDEIIPADRNASCCQVDLRECRQRFLDDKFDCERNCTEMCYFYSYQYQVSSNMVEKHDFAEEFHLRIQLRRQAHLEFYMNQKDSSWNLISQIGGIFNFYLGVSGLSIFFFLIYLFESGRRWWRLSDGERRGNDGEMEEHSTITDWRWRWMELLSTAMIGTEKPRSTAQSMKESKENSQLKLKVDELTSGMRDMTREMNEMRRMLVVMKECRETKLIGLDE